MAKPKMRGITCIERNGAVYWYARVDGRRVYCGKDADGRKLAEAARSKHVARTYENREVAAGLKVKKAEFKTVKDLANWYMLLPAVQQQASYKRKVQLAAHVLDFFGNMPLYAVDGDALEKYWQHRHLEGARHRTIELEFALLSGMFTLARKRKKISADQIPGEFPNIRDNNPRPVITDSQYKKLLEKADPDFRDVLVCAYESAMRSGEIRELRAGQIHLGVRHISGSIVDYIDLGIFDTKTGARRTVPVSAELKAVLERRMEGLDPDDRVFTYYHDGRRHTWSVTIISNRFKKVCEAAGIPHGDKTLNEKGERIGLVFHCLRHTRTTKWVEMGFSDEIVRRATGHSTLEAYQQYVKLDPSAVMRLVETKRHKNGIKTAQKRKIETS